MSPCALRRWDQCSHRVFELAQLVLCDLYCVGEGCILVLYKIKGFQSRNEVVVELAKKYSQVLVLQVRMTLIQPQTSRLNRNALLDVLY